MSKIQVNTNKVRFPVAPDLYGLFFEDINRSADGGLYPEMLRNRSFEDSILPLGCHVDKNNPDLLVTPTDYRSAFCGGEGRRNWNGDTAVFNDGYKNEKYFAWQFHQCAGCSPARYRKIHCGSITTTA